MNPTPTDIPCAHCGVQLATVWSPGGHQPEAPQLVELDGRPHDCAAVAA